jgi:hypothetical protein
MLPCQVNPATPDDHVALAAYRTETANALRPRSGRRGPGAQDTTSLLRLRRRRLLRLAGANRLVDHLPDLLVELVLLPNAVRGA